VIAVDGFPRTLEAPQSGACETARQTKGPTVRPFSSAAERLSLQQHRELFLLPINKAISAPSCKMRHDLRRDKLVGLHVVAIIAVDQQLYTGVLVFADQINGLRHGADKAAQRTAPRQTLALRRDCGLVASKQPAVLWVFSIAA